MDTLTRNAVENEPRPHKRFGTIALISVLAIVAVALVAVAATRPHPRRFTMKPLVQIDQGRVGPTTWKLSLGQNPTDGPYFRFDTSDGGSTGGTTDTKGEAMGGGALAPVGDGNIFYGKIDPRIVRVTVTLYDGSVLQMRTIRAGTFAFYYGVIGRNAHIKQVSSFDVWGDDVQNIDCPLGVTPLGEKGCPASETHWQ